MADGLLTADLSLPQLIGSIMTFEAIISYQETTMLASFNELPKFVLQDKKLKLRVDADTSKIAQQKVRINWRKIYKRLPQLMNARLIQLKAVKDQCPSCGAAELSFCHHS